MPARPLVPLFLQPGNPPVPFVGRTQEVARLTQAMRRAPVTLVWGFSGVGKTALVCAALAALPDERARTLTVDVRDRRGDEGDLMDLVARRLSELAGSAGADIAAEISGPAADEDPRARGRALVDGIDGALEGAGLWLLVDGVERIGDSPAFAAALDEAQRHARRARILCVCREDPRLPALRAQTFAVEPMPPADLRALLDDVQPGLPGAEASRWVARASGSPWRLLQMTLGADEVAGPEASLMALAPAAQSLLRTLALVSTAVPRDTLARAVRLPADDVLERLARRGYLEISARGVRLHNAARPIVGAVLDETERALRTQKLLAALTGQGAVAGRSDVAQAEWELFRELCPRPSGAVYVQACALARAAGDVALAEVPPPSAGRAEELAAFHDVIAARVTRAKESLGRGEHAGLDDELAAVSVLARAHAAPPAITGALDDVLKDYEARKEPAWTLDARTQSVQLPDGTRVDLADKKQLWELLAALGTRGGAATKEQLLEDAWGVRDYHPLHHDNRLKVAVRKLRRLLEAELGADPLEATTDGYRLRGRVRFL